MTDLDPKIWENPTLGEVGAGPFLPEIELQQAEDRNARLDGREPNIVEYVHRYPKLMGGETIPSLASDVVFRTPDGNVIEPEAPVAEDEVNEDQEPQEESKEDGRIDLSDL